jgi:prefoldin subunit 5
MGVVIQFPDRKKLLLMELQEELKMHEEEIQLCLDDLESINEHIVELTTAYEELLKLLCNLQGIPLPEERFNDKR